MTSVDRPSDEVVSRRKHGYRGLYAHKWTDEDYLQRIYNKCVIQVNGCILWKGHVNLKGYGEICYRNRNTMVTRLMWQIKVGPIPPGMHVCHTCDVRNCVNIDHLWLGTPKDNIRDMIEKKRNHFINQTHCKRGHEFTPENTYFKRPYRGKGPARMCRACQKLRHQGLI